MKKGLLTGIAILTTTPLTQAALIVVDSADGVSISTSHGGSDTIQIAEGFGLISIQILAGAANFGVDSGANIVFSDGSVDVSPTAVTSNRAYYASSSFQAGAGLGLNYLRLDMNQNGTYETVVEFTTGTVSGFSDDAITRYVYDSTDANLSIPDAVSAFSIPEPNSVLLIGLGLLSFVLRRHK